MSIVLAGPPGYFWKQGPMRDANEDLGSEVMRMRCCHFGRQFDCPSSLPGVCTCRWRPPTRAVRPDCGDARATQQGMPHNVLSMR
eukprot:7168045-Pyramimonas_sp.AAC.1